MSEDVVDAGIGAPGSEDTAATEPKTTEKEALELKALEALLFVAEAPMNEEQLAAYLPEGTDIRALLGVLRERYQDRGVQLTNVAGGWAFRTAPETAPYLRRETEVQRKLSRAAMETLAIITYHQPVTRADIELVRGVAVNKGTLDLLFEAGWIEPRGRRRTPGRPSLWVTTSAFLDHFGLTALDDLPGLDELKASGLLDLSGPPPPTFPGSEDDPDTDGADTENTVGDPLDDPLDDGDEGDGLKASAV